MRKLCCYGNHLSYSLRNGRIQQSYGEQHKANVSVVTSIRLALIGFEIKPSLFIPYVGFGSVLRTGGVLPPRADGCHGAP